MIGSLFQLFRVTVHPTEPLFFGLTARDGHRWTRPEILRRAIESMPRVPQSPRRFWRIANIDKVDEHAMLFCFGREGGHRTLPHVVNGKFVEETVEASPFVYGLVDVEYEVCALGQNLDLATDVGTIANHLVRTLSQSDIARSERVEFRAASIKDPRDFLERIRKAYRVRRLWVETLRPNPFDAEEDFVRPTARVVEALRAEKAKTTWTGDQLNVAQDDVAKVVHGAASTGGDAGARVQITEGSRPITFSMHSNQSSLTVDVHVDGWPRALLDKMRDTYRVIRNRMQR